MRSFFNYAKNRFLYNFLRLIIFMIIGFILADIVKAETISYELSETTITELSTIESSSKLANSNALIEYWEKNYASTYPYYAVLWTKPYEWLVCFQEIPTLISYKSTYQITASGMPYIYYYNNASNPATLPTSSTSTAYRFVLFDTTNNILSYDNYVISNFDLKSTIDFSFVYGDKTYNYATGDIIPSMVTFYNNLNNADNPDLPVDPEDPGTNDDNIEDNTDDNLDSQTIYNYLGLISLCLIIPIVLKFLNNMFSLKGSDL